VTSVERLRLRYQIAFSSPLAFAANKVTRGEKRFHQKERQEKEWQKVVRLFWIAAPPCTP
jgi:hypothetical protein